MKYYIETTLTTTFENAVELVKSNLPSIGFGVVTEFDVDKKFSEKLNVNFRKYKIIGACNPKYAYEVLLLEPMIGTMLPCNIIVQEIDRNTISVSAIDPIASMKAVGNPNLNKSAASIKEKLEKFIAELKV